jgi:DNA topoisomerase I
MSGRGRGRGRGYGRGRGNGRGGRGRGEENTTNEFQNRPINILNTPYLVIVESPSKCEKIESYLGFQYKCISSKGHIRQLCKIGTKKQNYKPHYELLQEKWGHVSFMRRIIEQFPVENIFLATDDDREGEGIAWHICEVFKFPVETTKRIIFHEITKAAVVSAVQNPTIIRMNIVRAQQTRQILDRMIGYKISPCLSQLLPHAPGEYLSAGRCQTPALRLIYENAVENDKKKKDALEQSIQGTFFSHPSTTLMKLSKRFLYCTNDCMEFLEESKTFSHILSLGKIVEKSKEPAPPLNTSRLLQVASSQLHLSPKMTMQYCQQLYQNGHITYMRTDSTKYAAPFLSQMQTFLKDTYGEGYMASFGKLVNQNKNDPHEAIRITNICKETVDGDARMKSLYQFIRTRTIESCMTTYIADHVDVQISAPKEAVYHHDLEIGKTMGWKRASMTPDEFRTIQIQKTGFRSYVQNQVGKAIPFHRIVSKVVSNETPRHYTEAGLIQKMESLGIGRPSTFSMLVETIQERKYVVKGDTEGETIDCKEYCLEAKSCDISVQVHTRTFGAEKQKLLLQDLGKQVILQLVEHFESLFSYGYTKRMEDSLDGIVQYYDVDVSNGGDVSNGCTEFDVCKECDDEIKTCRTPLQSKMKKSYEIDETCNLIFGRNGAYLSFHEEGKTNRPISAQVQLDFEKLERGEYTLGELAAYSDDALGNYEDEPLYVKSGPYGAYAEWGGKRQNLQSYLGGGKRKKAINISDVTFEQVKAMLDEVFEGKNSKNASTGIIRVLGPHMNIRNGKYGAYVFYQPPEQTKPSFLSLKTFKHGYLTCHETVLLEWLQKKHKIEVT